MDKEGLYQAIGRIQAEKGYISCTEIAELINYKNSAPWAITAYFERLGWTVPRFISEKEARARDKLAKLWSAYEENPLKSWEVCYIVGYPHCHYKLLLEQFKRYGLSDELPPMIKARKPYTRVAEQSKDPVYFPHSVYEELPGEGIQALGEKQLPDGRKVIVLR
jgi:hypothetical protein